MSGKVIAQKLHTMENGILGALNNSEISQRMASYGYTPERIQNEGKMLWEKASRLTSEHVKKYGEQYASSAESGQTQSGVYGRYMVILKVARVAFKDNPALLKGLEAAGRRPKSFSGWLRSSRIFYANLLANADAVAILANFGITSEALTQELQEVTRTEEVYSKELESRAGAQQSTAERDQAFDELCNWYSDFRAIARIALYDKPQLLEALGIVKK